MRTLAIIPARGGSKRVLGKNLCKVRGSTLVQLALASAEPCETVVLSSDDEQILTHADTRSCGPYCCVAEPWFVEHHRGPYCCGAEPWFVEHHRKPEHATSESQIEPVIADVLEEHSADAIVLLQPTSPFRTAAHVRGALALLVPGVDSVVSVVQDPGYRFMGRLATNGEYRAYRPDLSERGRSTDALDHRCPVRENGAIYVTRRDAFERSGLRMSGVMRAYVMSVRDSFEIDEPWELEAARAIAGCA